MSLDKDLEDYDSEADDDFVPNQESSEENNSDFDENGNRLKKKRKRSKKKTESRSRQPLGEKKNKKKGDRWC